ncbi:hypothetical protein GCM10007921_12780 [Tritonibacter mobilis]|nr:hypothetical protein GCM10007921_12780 [Tritonibacter mobilis]
MRTPVAAFRSAALPELIQLGRYSTADIGGQRHRAVGYYTSETYKARCGYLERRQPDEKEN